MALRPGHERTHREPNPKIRVLTRVAFGFRSPDALIALAMLALGGYRPELPHQQTAR